MNIAVFISIRGPEGHPSFPRSLSPTPIGERESRLNNPSFPRKRESRKVVFWRTQLYETSSGLRAANLTLGCDSGGIL